MGEALRRHIDFHHSELGEIAEPHVFLQAEHLSGESGRYNFFVLILFTDELYSFFVFFIGFMTWILLRV